MYDFQVFSSDEINVTSEEFQELLNATYLITHHLEHDDMLAAVVKAAVSSYFLENYLT